MICPVCKRGGFVPHALEHYLQSSRCPSCSGHWVSAVQYWKWREASPPKPPQRPTDAGPVELPVSDTAKAKLCPECQRLLTRFKVGHGLSFAIDRCGTCAGIWLDANEWENLKARNLHDDVHFIFSDAWQADVSREQREQGRERMMTEILGATDLAEIKRIKVWLDAHPQKSALYGMVLND